MSKKQAKSEGVEELPDWADDVTPTDEVMQKFYAPTGSFTPGPIRIPEAEQPPFPAVSDIPPHPSEPISTHTPSVPPIQPEPSIESTVLPPAPSQPTTEIKDEPPLRHLNVTAGHRKTAKKSAISSASEIEPLLLFDDFSHKWRLYLYPGQLAVMRALVKITYAKGRKECFTTYGELADETKMSRRNCIKVMNSLIVRGFVERIEIKNDAAAKGLRLRVHLEPELDQ